MLGISQTKKTHEGKVSEAFAVISAAFNESSEIPYRYGWAEAGDHAVRPAGVCDIINASYQLSPPCI